MELKYLEEDQNARFDQEYHSLGELNAKIAALKQALPNGPRTILDLGGGNGKFLDSLLNEFPDAEGYLIDISEHLLGMNRVYPRKHLVHGTIGELEERFPSEKFDVITINWVLHHLVGPSYQTSISNVQSALRACANLLAPQGVIVIAENMFDGLPIDDAPSRIVYGITSVKAQWFVKRIRYYFNTAGVGVCFHSQRAWERLFDRAGLRIKVRFFGEFWGCDLKRRLLFIPLMLKSQRHGHYLLSFSRG
jgi:2-polyprenyl-3-methyl-5-hydroxy-6-metoxy-1,4-benzoquinol methylase